MATDTSYEESAQNATTITTQPGETEEERVKRYAKEQKTWQTDLRQYWTQMDKNEEMYEFYKSEYNETSSNIALNTPFAIIESQLEKENQAAIQVTVKAEGDNTLGEFEEWVSASIKGAIEDKRVASIKGTFRKKKERWSRGLKVVGNAVAEVAYCYVTQVRDGKKTVIADNPYIINRHYKDLTFNSSRQFDSSNVYYITDYMRLQDMKNQEYQEIPGKNGKKTVLGKFRNLTDLQTPKNTEIQRDDQEIRYIAGDKKVNKKNEAIKVVTRWELKPAGWTRCVYANDRVMVMPDEVDPFKIGSHNLLLGMRYVIEGRPYAYGEIDPIYKPVRAQDTIVNQKIEIINKYLRGSYIAGSSIDVESLMMVLDQGGVMAGNGDDLHSVPVTAVPESAFQEVQELQQAIERAARYSPYSSGTPQSSDDKTQGTKGGIIALQTGSEPHTETQIDDVEDMFMEPYAYIVLRMKANYMSSDEVFFAQLEGKNEEWIAATKGILSGTATVQDFVTAGVISADDAQQLGGVKTPVFDVSWVLDVKLSSQSIGERLNQASQEQALIEFAIDKLQAQFDPDRTVEYLAEAQDADEIKSLLMTTQEKQQKMQQAQQAAQQQFQQEVQLEQVKHAPAPQQPESPTPQKAPAESLNYKDAPADIQRQIEAQAGLVPSQLHPQVANTLKQPLPTPPEPMMPGERPKAKANV